RDRFRSPAGASLVSVLEARLPAGGDLRRSQEAWLAANRANPRFRDLEVEREEWIEAGGRRGHLVVFRARIEDRGAVRPQMRAAHVYFEHDDGAFTQLVLVGSELDWGLDALDRVLASID